MAKEGHWIRYSNRPSNQKFICSECGMPSFCISYLGTFQRNKIKISTCDYNFCPRCGHEMDNSYEALEAAREE